MIKIEHGALTLAQLGWRPFFQQQLRLEQWEYPVARVIAQHRNRLDLLGEAGERGLDLRPDMPEITVGDWLLLSPKGNFDKLLERQSLFRLHSQRVDAGGQGW
jgi:ribosome biogenesis GTPase